MNCDVPIHHMPFVYVRTSLLLSIYSQYYTVLFNNKKKVEFASADFFHLFFFSFFSLFNSFVIARNGPCAARSLARFEKKNSPSISISARELMLHTQTQSRRTNLTILHDRRGEFIHLGMCYASSNLNVSVHCIYMFVPHCAWIQWLLFAACV